MSKNRLNFMQDNTGEKIIFTIKNKKTGQPVDMSATGEKELSSATLRAFDIRDKTFIFSSSLDITKKEYGVLIYTPIAADMATPNDDVGLEVQLTFADATTVKIDGASIGIKTTSPTS